MDQYAGRLLADRYRLPRPPSDVFELVESRAFDTASGQEVYVRQVPLPEVVDAELLDGPAGGHGPAGPGAASQQATRTPGDPVVRRAVEAAAAAAALPDHARLDQIFDVFVQGDGLWIVSELVPARPLATFLAEERLSPYRAAEVAADLLAALRVVHAHGWAHRNITSRTVLICDDGRALLTGLATGAAEEVLCGYDPFPVRPGESVTGSLPAPREPDGSEGVEGAEPERSALPGPADPAGPGAPGANGPDEVPPRASEPYPLPPGTGPTDDTLPAGGPRGVAPWGAPRGDHGPPPDVPATEGPSAAALERASRSGAIAAYRAGARAGADAISGRARALGDPAARDGAPSPGTEGDPQDRHAPAEPAAPSTAAERGEGPTELPGRPRPSRSVPTGWESAPPGATRSPVETRAATGGTSLPAPTRAAVPTRADEPAVPDASATGGQPALGAVPDPARRYRGPDSARAAERARQARMTTVGAVTERWAPEQAGPVYEHWRLAPPVGPAADLWALGALLFRAVQGHPPYPEESTGELTQAVCAEQPAFAEECGALRPVIESLLRQDPTERPSPEELRGWLRSIIRSAPEPDVGRRTAGGPRLVLEAGRDADPARLPIVRDRGELVSRRGPRAGDPRRLGRLLLALVFLLVAGGFAYATLVLPPADDDRSGEAGEPREEQADAGGNPTDEATLGGNGTDGGEEPPTEPSDPAPDAQPDPAPDGFETVHDPAGFRIVVPEGWDRSEGPDGQAVFSGDGMELVVVPGRDSTAEFGDAPMDYQLSDQPELGDYRAGDWSSSNNLTDVMVGNVRMAEGSFVWSGADGREFAHNRAMIMDGDYHVVLVRGPEERQGEADDLFGTVADSYRVTDG